MMKRMAEEEQQAAGERTEADPHASAVSCFWDAEACVAATLRLFARLMPGSVSFSALCKALHLLPLL